MGTLVTPTVSLFVCVRTTSKLWPGKDSMFPPPCESFILLDDIDRGNEQTTSTHLVSECYINKTTPLITFLKTQLNLNYTTHGWSICAFFMRKMPEESMYHRSILIPENSLTNLQTFHMCVSTYTPTQNKPEIINLEDEFLPCPGCINEENNCVKFFYLQTFGILLF